MICCQPPSITFPKVGHEQWFNLRAYTHPSWLCQFTPHVNFPTDTYHYHHFICLKVLTFVVVTLLYNIITTKTMLSNSHNK